jgi:hypothetical protein
MSIKKMTHPRTKEDFLLVCNWNVAQNFNIGLSHLVSTYTKIRGLKLEREKKKKV